MATRNQRPAYIKVYESAEHQARVFTAEFQMPRKEVQTLTSPQDIQSRYNVSKQAAEIRFKEVVENHRPRELPDWLTSYISARRTAPVTPQSSDRSYFPARSKNEIDKVWEAAPVAADHDPSEYRLSRKAYLVKRSEYLKMTDLGWFVHSAQICAFLETDAATSLGRL
jgi:hypothetical protein